MKQETTHLIIVCLLCAGMIGGFILLLIYIGTGYKMRKKKKKDEDDDNHTGTELYHDWLPKNK
jgi:hypothetical protein